MSIFGDGVIELYGYRLRVTTQPIIEQLVSVFPEKIVIGDNRRVDDPVAATVVMQDWVDGGLRKIENPADDFNRFYFGTAMTWFNRQLTLPALTRFVSPLAWSDGKTKEVRAGAEMGNVQYIAWDDRLTKLDVNENLIELGLQPPPAPVVSMATTGGTITAGVVQVLVTWTNSRGETSASPASSVTTTGTTAEVTANMPTLAGDATSWSMYLTAPGGSTFFKWNTVAVSQATMTATSVPAGAAPPSANSALGVGSASVITDMLVYRPTLGTLSGVNVLVISARSGSGSTLWLYDPTNGLRQWTAWTTGVQAMCVWDDKLVICTDANALFVSNDVSTSTALLGQNIVPIGNGDVTALLIFPDFNGLDSLQIATAQGLYFYDEIAQKVRRTRYAPPRLTAQGVGSVVHRDNLYYTHPGTAITRYTNTTVSEEGLDRDEGLPVNFRGNVMKLNTSLNFLLAAVMTSQNVPSINPVFGGDEITYASTMPGTAGYAAIYGQDRIGGGWHNLFLSDNLGTGCRWVGSSSADTKFRLFFGMNGNLGIQDFFPDVFNPLDNPTQQFASTGYLVSPWNDMGWSEISKLMIRQESEATGAGIVSGGADCVTAVRPACNITIEYGIDRDDNTWYPLQTITTARPPNAYYGPVLPSNNAEPIHAGISVKSIRYRITLNRCDNVSHTPVLTFTTATFLKEMAARWGYRFQVDATTEEFGLQPSEIANLLRRLCDPDDLGGQLGVFNGWVDGKFITRAVKVSELSGQLSEGTLQKGIYNVALIAFPA